MFTQKHIDKHRKEFYTLPIGQREMWSRAKKGGFEPLLNLDGSLYRTICPKCNRNALVYNKVDTSYVACSEKHLTPFDK